MRRYPITQRLIADMAGRRYPIPPYPGNGGGFANLVIIPVMQAVLIAAGVGVSVGCLVWLSIAAAYSLPVGVFVGSAVYAAILPGLLERARGDSAPLQVIDDSPMPTEPPTPPIVLVNGKAAADVTPEAQARTAAPSRFADFVRACELDTGRDRLEALGFGRGETNYYREMLMRAGLAKYRTANPRNGWSLTAPADAIVGMVGMVGDMPTNSRE